MKKSMMERRLNSFHSSQKISDLIRMASGEFNEVACVAVTNGEAILYGKRRDNGLWAMPGGHVHKGETVHQGACRELYEESGIKTDTLSYLGSKLAANGLYIHSFIFDISKRPDVVETMSAFRDPDEEFEELTWVTPDTPKWEEITKQFAHNPRDITLEFMGLQ